MLSVTNLACTRGDRCLFTGLGFTLHAGEWLHLTGENGAGKTSLMRILCGLAPAEAGEIRWRGSLIKELGDEFRRELLYLGHQPAVKEELSAAENVRITAALAGVALSERDADDLLRQVGLAGREELPVRVLSQGQRRRVALTRLLWNRAPLWVLDEAFVALDHGALAMLTGIIGEHLARGGLAVLTSHQELEIKGHPGRTLKVVAENASC